MNATPSSMLDISSVIIIISFKKTTHTLCLAAMAQNASLLQSMPYIKKNISSYSACKGHDLYCSNTILWRLSSYQTVRRENPFQALNRVIRFCFVSLFMLTSNINYSVFFLARTLFKTIIHFLNPGPCLKFK